MLTVDQQNIEYCIKYILIGQLSYNTGVFNSWFQTFVRLLHIPATIRNLGRLVRSRSGVVTNIYETGRRIRAPCTLPSLFSFLQEDKKRAKQAARRSHVLCSTMRTYKHTKSVCELLLSDGPF